MRGSTSYLLAACLVVAIAALGYWIYTDQKSSELEVNVGGRTLSVETR